MSVTGGIIAAGALAGSVGSAAISSSAAGKAASTQSNAADYAAQLQKQEADNSLAFQKQEWQTQQGNMAAWLQAGQGALSNLNGLLSTPGQGLLTPWTQQFQAPTAATEQNDPGYQFRLQQGEGALENSAAARGSLLSGNTEEAQQAYGQNYASNEYSNVYSRAMQQYQQNYGIYENNQSNTYNRLAALAGTGQTAATTLGQEGQTAANNVSNIDLTSGAQQGQDMQNAAAATASGYIGSANAWGGALSGSSNNLMQLMMMNQMYGGGGSGGGGSPLGMTGALDMSGQPGGVATIPSADPTAWAIGG